MDTSNLIHPRGVIIKNSNASEGLVEFSPLLPGLGITIGNGLRRVLLSYIQGFAITSIKIEGVEHEFSTIKGVLEDVTEIVLNFKSIRLKSKVENVNQEIVTACLKDNEKITAGDLGKFMTNFIVLNPELIICNKEKYIPFNITFSIAKGRGYVPAEENQNPDAPIGTIAIDAIYTPIKKVKYTVENCRVEQKSDYEKLLLEIITDGSISTLAALSEASNLLIIHFLLFSDSKQNLSIKTEEKNVKNDEMLHLQQLLDTKISDFELSVRAQNCLKYAKITTLGELVSKSEQDLKKLKNFGVKTLQEIYSLLRGKNLSLGMNISKYRNKI